jgi:hypothetical protein
MQITQTDDYKNETHTIKFINSMEGKNYPIYTTMYHPEYQLLDFVGKYRWPIVKNDTTDEIAFRVSLHLNRVARNNKNRMRPEF